MQTYDKDQEEMGQIDNMLGTVELWVTLLSF